MMKTTTITEQRQIRRTYGHDETAINRHAVRVYLACGVRRQGAGGSVEFHLNRTLDGCPPFYSLYFYKPDPAHPIYLNVGGKQYWGKGWSWSKAEQQAFKAITAYMEARR